MEGLYNFITKFKALNDEYNYTSMLHPTGKYNINNPNMKNFIELYHKYIFIDNNKAALLERPSCLSPIKIDIDLHYKSDKKKRIYTDVHIERLCRLYMKHIEDYIVFNEEEKERLCFVMEKSDCTMDKKNKDLYKDGIHIMFPYLICDVPLELKLRELVIADLQSEVFNDINVAFVNTSEQIIDKNVIGKNCWFMYGSSKCKSRALSCKKQTYLLSKVYKCHSNEVKLVGYGERANIVNNDNLKLYKPMELLKLLTIRNLLDIEQIMIKIDKVEELNKLNINLINNNLNMSDTDSNNSEINQSTLRCPTGQRGKKTKNTCTYTDIICDLVNCLSKERATAFDSWSKVGWALNNIHNTDSKLYDKWVEWSRISDQHKNQTEADLSYIKKFWKNSKNSNLGEGSLRMWAKEDDAKAYENVLYEENKKELIASIQCNIYDIGGLDDLSKDLKKMPISPTTIAQLLHNMYKHEFRLVDTKGKGIFYHFRNHRWSPMCDNTLLRQKIRHIKEKYIKYLHNLTEQEKQQLSYNKDHQDKIFKTINKLDSTSFKNDVMTECKDVFYNQDDAKTFMDGLDNNVFLLGFENGIYDLSQVNKRGGIPFRPGAPEDMVSISTGIDYIPYKYVKGTQDYNEIKQFIDQVFVKKNVGKYVMMHLASCLNGATSDERFHFWSGCGGNGKSKLIELLGLGMGDYFCSLPVTILTSKRNKSNEASPEMAVTRGKRFAVLQEPESGSKINEGLLKEITGGDKIQARELYKAPITFKPQFKLVLTCNDKPALKGDGGIWRRIRLVEFESKFVEKPSETNPFEFPIDICLSQKFEDWKEPFMSILLDYYRLYQKDGLTEPDEILEYTKSYKDDPCDMYKRFVDDMIIKIEREEEEENVYLSQKSGYDAYIKWLDEENMSKRKKSEFVDYMNRKFGNDKKGWLNIGIQGQEMNQEYDILSGGGSSCVLD